MKRARRLLALAGLVLCLSVSSWAQVGRVDGEFIGLDGKPQAGGRIVFDQQEDGDRHYEMDTNARGQFVQAGVIAGLYRVTVQVDGQPRAVAVIRVSPGSNDVRVNLARKEIESTEFSRDLGISERAVRNLTMVDGGPGAVNALVLPPPANDDERKKLAAASAAMKEAFEAGRAALAKKDYDEAIRQFKLAAKDNTTQHVIYANLGVAYEMAQKYKEAAENYAEAQRIATSLKIPPKQTNYLNNLTVVYALSGDIENAMEYADQAAAVDPTKAAQSFYDIGAVLTNRRNTAGAIEAFKRTVKADPNMAEAYFQMALAYFADPATIRSAVPMLQKYLETTPKGPNAETARALMEAAK